MQKRPTRTFIATAFAVLAVGATTTGAVAASREPAPAPVPAEAPAPKRAAPAPAPAPAPRRAAPKPRRAAPAPAPKPRRTAPAERRRAHPAPAPARERHAAAAAAAGETEAVREPAVSAAAMDSDRNPHYTRDLNAWVDCMNAEGLRTVATMTGITAGGWTYGTPTTARERHLLSEAGWQEAREIEVSCQEQAFGE